MKLVLSMVHYVIAIDLKESIYVNLISTGSYLKHFSFSFILHSVQLLSLSQKEVQSFHCLVPVVLVLVLTDSDTTVCWPLL